MINPYQQQNMPAYLQNQNPQQNVQYHNPHAAPANPQAPQMGNHPNIQVHIPPVNPPTPYGAQGLNPSPEQTLQNAYNSQQNMNLNPGQYNDPRIQYTPNQEGFPQQQVVQQTQNGFQNPNLQQTFPQQQQVEEYGVNESDFKGVPRDALENFVTEAQEAQIPQANLNEFVGQRVQQMQKFKSPEEYQAYDGKMQQLHSALSQQFGEQGAVEKVKTARENILKMGGRPMLDKFLTDPSMLEPEVIMPFINGGQQDANPYAQYLQGQGAPQGNQQPQGPGMMPGQMQGQYPYYQQQGATPPMSPQQLEARIAENYHPRNMANRGTPEWNQEMQSLFAQKAMMQRQAAAGGMGLV